MITSNQFILKNSHLHFFFTEMAAVPTSGAPAQVSMPMQLMAMRPSQNSVMQPQQVRSLTPRMILSPQVLQNAVRTSGQPNVCISNYCLIRLLCSLFIIFYICLK